MYEMGPVYCCLTSVAVSFAVFASPFLVLPANARSDRGPRPEKGHYREFYRTYPVLQVRATLPFALIDFCLRSPFPQWLIAPVFKIGFHLVVLNVTREENLKKRWRPWNRPGLYPFLNLIRSFPQLDGLFELG